MDGKAAFMEYAQKRLDAKEKDKKAKEKKAFDDYMQVTRDTVERIRRHKRVTGRH